MSRENELIIKRVDPNIDTVFSGCTFDSINSAVDQGGAIFVDKQLRITIMTTEFINCSSIREGGSLYASKTTLSIFCAGFVHSHTSKIADDIGGNAFTLFGAETIASDFFISHCWDNTNCGDSPYHITSGLYKITRYNVSNCIDGIWGGACGDFWGMSSDSHVSFANFVGNLGYSCLAIFYGGTFYSEFLNMLNNTGSQSIFIDVYDDYTEFKRCYLFKESRFINRGIFTMIECFTNFEYEGAVVTYTTYYAFNFNQDCKLIRTKLFTQQHHPTFDDTFLVFLLQILLWSSV